MKSEYLHHALIAACLAMLLVALSRKSDPFQHSAQSSAPSTEMRALKVIPRDAPLLVTLNLQAPRAEALRSVLFDAELPGLGRVSEVCGYDPTRGLSSVALALFRSEHDASTPALGIVASGRFDQDKLADCAERLVRSRGGVPDRQQTGSMVLVRDTARPGAEIALLQNSLVAVSDHEHLRQMLQALDGKVPDIISNPTHQSLRNALGPDAAVLASLELDAGWLERMFAGEPVDSSPLATLKAAAVRLAVHDDIEVTALLRCRDAEGCQRLQSFLADFAKRVLPLMGQPWSSALADANLKLRAHELRVSWKIDPALLNRIVQDLARHPPTAADSPAPPSLSASPPGEILPAQP